MTHHVLWIIRYEGSGYSLSEAADTEPGAYLRARAHAQLAEAGTPIPVTLRIGGQEAVLPRVGRIWILRRDVASNDYRPHSHSWFRSHPSPRALTPLPDDF
ncbi:hypothetical protein [Streptomyces capitiformicae]|uniref:Uncharacterized protein n=1 Tax=Streptomyces capitiformicae TaxID=2014920 RepID=A0A919L8I8_9ACTN|nr:hypothetical protein [Streptomyces capitiformicae]GHH87883.1 hypothetical protein GCM10017771_30890 [Streptomyces capitiformicae]